MNHKRGMKGAQGDPGLPLYSGFPGFPLGFLVCFCPGGLMADLIEDSLSLKPSGPYPVLNHIR